MNCELETRFGNADKRRNDCVNVRFFQIYQIVQIFAPEFFVFGNDHQYLCPSMICIVQKLMHSVYDKIKGEPSQVPLHSKLFCPNNHGL